jgi:ribosomal protein S18 acetylase RimI-like enzyme
MSKRRVPISPTVLKEILVMVVERLNVVSQEDLEGIIRIYRTYSQAKMGVENVRAAISSTCVLVARALVPQGKIIGFVTLVIYHRMKGRVAQVEDIVVDEDHRRRGVGTMLLAECVKRASEAGCLDVHLMTYPNLEAANCLYRATGWTEFKTNTYRKTL